MVAGGEGEPHQAVRREQSHRGFFPVKSALQTGPSGPHPSSGGQTPSTVQPEEDQACRGLPLGPGGGQDGALPQQIPTHFFQSRQVWAARFKGASKVHGK